MLNYIKTIDKIRKVWYYIKCKQYRMIERFNR